MTNQIPKIIHYCWFGGNPLPESVKKWIDTWKKYCPDYEIRECNETNFDVNICQFTQEAYKKRKWAYIADYARLYALVHYGGIYLDTDVEICKPLDSFLIDDAFMGFESDSALSTAIIGAEQNNPLIKHMLNQYTNKHFIRNDGTLDLTPNPQILTEVCVQAGLELNGRKQNLNGMMIYPSEVFSPKDYKTGILHKTANTVTIHHFDESWINKDAKMAAKIKKRFNDNTFGKVIAFPFTFKAVADDSGYKAAFKHYIKKYVTDPEMKRGGAQKMKH